MPAAPYFHLKDAFSVFIFMEKQRAEFERSFLFPPFVAMQRFPSSHPPAKSYNGRVREFSPLHELRTPFKYNLQPEKVRSSRNAITTEFFSSLPLPSDRLRGRIRRLQYMGGQTSGDVEISDPVPPSLFPLHVQKYGSSSPFLPPFFFPGAQEDKKVTVFLRHACSGRFPPFSSLVRGIRKLPREGITRTFFSSLCQFLRASFPFSPPPLFFLPKIIQALRYTISFTGMQNQLAPLPRSG